MTIFKGRKAIMSLLFAVFITALSFCGIFSALRAKADTVGAFVVTGGANNVDYTYASNVLTIKTATSLTIANTNPSSATTDVIILKTSLAVDSEITVFL